MKSAYGAAAASLFLLVGLSAASPAKAQAKKIKNCTTITESGAYKVTKNLVASGDCIVIEASFVNLDLGGFTLTGDGTGTGVLVPGVLDLEGIDLRNGNVTNFDTGINLSALLTSVRNVRAQDNVGDGIRAGGPAVVTGCQAHDNGGVGISAFGTSTVHRNIASSNGSHGFGMGTSVATGNTSRGNGGDGFSSLGADGVLIGNHATNNDGNGITIVLGVVRENTASSNDLAGISASCPTSIVGNSLRGNTGPNVTTTGVGCVQSDNATD
jgi:hypothetical protein